MRTVETMNREDAISYLTQLDSNGVWTDKDCDSEGWPRLTTESAREALSALLARDK